jgi:hypothetical protein
MQIWFHHTRISGPVCVVPGLLHHMEEEKKPGNIQQDFSPDPDTEHCASHFRL